MADTVSNEPTPGAMQVAVDFAYKWRSGASHKQLALTLDAFADRRITEKDAEIAALKAEIDGLRAQVEWRPMKTAPTGWFNFFLVRPKGTHPGNGKPFVPTVVQHVDGELYSPENEIKPLYFGQRERDSHPLKTELEWMPFPTSPSHTIPSKGDDR